MSIISHSKRQGRGEQQLRRSTQAHRSSRRLSSPSCQAVSAPTHQKPGEDSPTDRSKLTTSAYRLALERPPANLGHNDDTRKDKRRWLRFTMATARFNLPSLQLPSRLIARQFLKLPISIRAFAGVPVLGKDRKKHNDQLLAEALRGQTVSNGGDPMDYTNKKQEKPPVVPRPSAR